VGRVGAGAHGDGGERVIRLGAGRLERVVAVGAHCDDIAIGAGGTLLTLCRAHPGLRVDALVLSGGARSASRRSSRRSPRSVRAPTSG